MWQPFVAHAAAPSASHCQHPLPRTAATLVAPSVRAFAGLVIRSSLLLWADASSEKSPRRVLDLARPGADVVTSHTLELLRLRNLSRRTQGVKGKYGRSTGRAARSVYVTIRRAPGAAGVGGLVGAGWWFGHAHGPQRGAPRRRDGDTRRGLANGDARRRGELRAARAQACRARGRATGPRPTARRPRTRSTSGTASSAP